MRRLLPLCFLLAACGDTPAVSEPPPAAAEVPAEPVAPAPPAAPDVDVDLVDGVGQEEAVSADGEESYNLAALPLHAALRERYFNVRGGSGGDMLFEDDGSGRSGPLTIMTRDGEDPGTWALDGGQLTLTTQSAGAVVYTIVSRTADGMTFRGPEGELVLQDTAG